jgi:hypothetical protein
VKHYIACMLTSMASRDMLDDLKHRAAEITYSVYFVFLKHVHKREKQLWQIA